MLEGQVSEFGGILLFIIGGILFVLIAMTAARLLRPNRPNEEKLTSYECGEEAVGSAWGPFNVRFYIIALIFILFDIELVFLFPWAVVFGQKELIAATNGLWGWFALAEMAIFIIILATGLAYAWAKGYLDWIRPEIKVPAFESKVPAQLYQKLNEMYKGKQAPVSEETLISGK
ncbi:NADH-quinone oxidoreductase subunit A [Rhodocytophaga rosea]|uniref:NADH-quinone oxidoreductase subunit A n=1 Tax=Rhodocytophaga rosea TaxID=2704465 RepID=A0A6C0GLT9_9BACT|nr:NADH-quinone oxidoreductase subunit A [Rhodocytophaga rosea]QHT68995.1 NADH-quinone oxidoreductase subunit A [Rhodocytophaga rosea]